MLPFVWFTDICNTGICTLFKFSDLKRFDNHHSYVLNWRYLTILNQSYLTNISNQRITSIQIKQHWPLILQQLKSGRRTQTMESSIKELWPETIFSNTRQQDWTMIRDYHLKATPQLYFVICLKQTGHHLWGILTRVPIEWGNAGTATKHCNLVLE